MSIQTALKITAFDLKANAETRIRALIGQVSAGQPLELFGEEEEVDLNYLLTKGNAESLLLRIEGDSMHPEIDSGDWVMLDCGKEPQPNDIVVARLNGGYTIKIHKVNNGRGKNGLYLVPGNGDYKTREVTSADEYRILGVVTYIVKRKR
jgi:DNA polymerase V